MTQRVYFVCHAGEVGERLDRAILKHLGDSEIISRTRLKKLIESGYLLCDGQPLNDPSRKIRKNETFSIDIPPYEPEPVAEPENIPLDIAYEDEDIIIVNKPAGMTVHPAPGNRHATLVNALIAHAGSNLSVENGIERPGIVHRIDKNTSGLLVVAKNNSAHKGLAEQFSKHTVKRAYSALVIGNPFNQKRLRNLGAIAERRENSITISAPIWRDSVRRKRMAVMPNGRHAISHFDFNHVYSWLGVDFLTLVTCRLETGRTHQIRVHANHIGTPVVGDPVYHSTTQSLPHNLPKEIIRDIKDFNRQVLHAALLGFNHPRTGEIMEFTSNVPDDIQKLMDSISDYKKHSI